MQQNFKHSPHHVPCADYESTMEFYLLKLCSVLIQYSLRDCRCMPRNNSCKKNNKNNHDDDDFNDDDNDDDTMLMNFQFLWLY